MHTEEEETDDSQESIETVDDKPPVMIRRKFVPRQRRSTTIKMLRDIGENLKTSGALVAVFSFLTVIFGKGKK